MRIITSRKAFTMVEIMVVMAVVGLLSSIAIPNFVKAGHSAKKQACIANMKRIEEAKVFWALSGGVGTPEMDDLVPDYIKKTPVCPEGGNYTVNDIDTCATCSLSGDPYFHLFPVASGETEE